MSKTVVRKMNHLKMHYVDLNVQYLKVVLSKKYVNVNFTKTKLNVKRNQKLHVNVIQIITLLTPSTRILIIYMLSIS